MKTQSNLTFVILVEEKFCKRNFIKYVLLVLIAVCRLIKDCMFKDKLLLAKFSPFWQVLPTKVNRRYSSIRAKDLAHGKVKILADRKSSCVRFQKQKVYSWIDIGYVSVTLVSSLFIHFEAVTLNFSL